MPEGEHFEYRMWLLRQSYTSEEIEADLNRLNREFGWRCIGFVPQGTLLNGRTSGHFLLERPLVTGEKIAND